MPDRYRLGALIRLVCDRLASDHVLRLRSNDQVLELRGRALTLGDLLRGDPGREATSRAPRVAVWRRPGPWPGLVATGGAPGCIGLHEIVAGVS